MNFQTRSRLFAENKDKDTSAKGSYDYAPAEQFGFAQTDRRTDIYSLGVTLNEISTGVLPSVRVCPGRLGIFIRRCTEFDPGRRYQTAEQAGRNLKRLQRMPLFISAGTVAAVLAAAAVLLIPARPSGVEPVSTGRSPSQDTPDFQGTWDSQGTSDSQGMPDSRQSPDSQDMPDSSDEPYVFVGDDGEEDDWYLDRIIWTQEHYRYPLIYMFEDQKYEFTTDLGTGAVISVSARKSKERLKFTCTLGDGKKTKFNFDDVHSETYKKMGHSINTDIEETTPQYEVLFDDIDEDGKTEMLITLAWRRRIFEADSPSRYYFTEYNSIWVVYADEKNNLCCSEPLYVADSATLETDSLLFDRHYSEWYYFKNGKWNRLSFFE